MAYQEKSFQARDGKTIVYYEWAPAENSSVKAIVQIAHGMAEHAQRYDRFASFLVKNGFAVFANDHRGHGKTAGSQEEIGYKEDGDFWGKAVADMRSLQELAKAQYPGRPYFLFGHSMGSFLSRNFIAKFGNELNGAILSGTGGDPGFLGKIGLLIAKIESFFKGRKKPSPLLDTLSFGQFNREFKPNRTGHDWLSKDEKEVDKYVADPTCGTVFTTGFFIDLLRGINLINKKETFQNTPKQLPIYLFAGALDPVGDKGKGVEEVFKKYKEAGIQNVSCKLYEIGRHEMLNETNRDEVYDDILKWLKQFA
jgi:alpha-beta hydrolase superfamily lysophospholipase